MYLVNTKVENVKTISSVKQSAGKPVWQKFLPSATTISTNRKKSDKLT